MTLIRKECFTYNRYLSPLLFWVLFHLEYISLSATILSSVSPRIDITLRYYSSEKWSVIIIVDLQRFQPILNMISKINFQPFANVFVFQPISNLVTKMNIRIDMSSFTVWSDRGGRIWGHLDPLNWGRATFNLCDKSKNSMIFDTRNLRKHFFTFFVKSPKTF